MIPKEFIGPIDQGIQEAAKSGAIAGYEVVNFKAAVTDGSYHEVDSSEMAYKIAASMAFKEAVRKADPCLMEPMMKVEIIGQVLVKWLTGTDQAADTRLSSG